MHAHVGTFMLWQEYGGLRTNYRHLCTVWGLGIELWSSALAAVTLPTEPRFNSVKLEKQYCGVNSVPFLLRVLPKSDSTKSWFCLLLVP